MKFRWQYFLVFAVLQAQLVLSQKNILFLAADDLRPNLGSYDDSNKGIFKQPKMHTPNLDALAAKSVVFEKAYDQVALCGPSRTSLLTTRRPDTTKILNIGYYWREYGGNYTTLPQFFLENGYTTFGAGKIFHGGPSSNHNDVEFSWSKGPEVPFGFRDQYPDPYPEKGDVSWRGYNKTTLDKVPLQDTSNANWLLTRIKQAARAWKKNSQPFFAAYGVHKPHTPWYFPEEFLDYYPEDVLDVPDNQYAPVNMPNKAWNVPPIFRQFTDTSPEELGIPDIGNINVTLPDSKVKELRRAYYAATSYGDYELGRIIDELYNQGLENDTMIVFWGDHGWQLGEHDEWCKQNLFEITNRVPMMIKIPGVTDEGMKSSNLVELVDIFPTLVEAAGFASLEPCPNQEEARKVQLCTEGRSLMPLINKSDKEWEDTVFWQYDEDWYHDKIVPNSMGYSVRTSDYRYTEYVTMRDLGGFNWEPEWDNPVDHEELYDLRKDPQENINVYNDPHYKSIKNALSKKLHAGWKGRK